MSVLIRNISYIQLKWTVGHFIKLNPVDKGELDRLSGKLRDDLRLDDSRLEV